MHTGLSTTGAADLKPAGLMISQVMPHEADAGRSDIEQDNIAARIQHLEDQFDLLRQQFLAEVKARSIPVATLGESLLSLPLSLKAEYQTSISSKVPYLIGKEVITTEFFMIHLNPLLSFIDYGLLAHLICKFGSDSLKKDMRSYENIMKIFKKETTIKDLVNFLPGSQESPPNFSVLKAKIDKDPKDYTLEELDMLRRRLCAQLQLSEILFHLIALDESR